MTAASASAFTPALAARASGDAFRRENRPGRAQSGRRFQGRRCSDEPSNRVRAARQGAPGDGRSQAVMVSAARPQAARQSYPPASRRGAGRPEPRQLRRRGRAGKDGPTGGRGAGFFPLPRQDAGQLDGGIHPGAAPPGSGLHPVRAARRTRCPETGDGPGPGPARVGAPLVPASRGQLPGRGQTLVRAWRFICREFIARS